MELLQTKLFIPPPGPNRLRRPRLYARLDEAVRLGSRLILLSAPAGYGKTTLLSEWIDPHRSSPALQPRPQFAWLTLDESDSSPAAFLSYLTAALRTLRALREAGVGEGVQELLGSSPGEPPLEAVLTPLINSLAALQNGPFILILDDYHAITAAPAVQRGAAFLVEHLPPQLRLVIASRSDPPLPLSRWRGRGQLAELRAADLRLTPGESAEFLNRVMGLELDGENLQALSERTEGWAVGLALAGLVLQGESREAGQAPPALVERLGPGNQYLLDYLVEEVLSRLPEEDQAFLQETAILERLCGPLCEAVTGQADGQARLERLAHSGLFLTPADEEGRWFRYHRLFADLLRHRLRRYQKERVPVLFTRAARWHAAEGDLFAALDCWLQAGELAEAARLLEGRALLMLERGELFSLANWLARFPAGFLRSRPWLCVYSAWALLLTGQMEGLEARLLDADAAAEETLPAEARENEPGRGRGELLAHLDAIRAYRSAAEGRVELARELAGRALERLPAGDLSIRSLVAFVLGGVCYLLSDLEGAGEAFEQAISLGKESGNLHVVLPAMHAAAALHALRGRLRRAESAYREALLYIQQRTGRLLPVASSALVGLGELLYEWDDLEGAKWCLEEGLELCRQWGNPDSLASSLLALAEFHRHQGDLETAHNFLIEAQALRARARMTPELDDRLLAAQMRQSLAAGELQACLGLAQERGLPEGEPLPTTELAYAAYAGCLAALGDPGEAAGLLSRLVQSAEKGGRAGRLPGLLAFEAVARRRLGREDRALGLLERAFTLAAPEGYLRTFLDQGQPLYELLGLYQARLAEDDPLGGYVRKLIAAYRKTPVGDVVSPQAPGLGADDHGGLAAPQGRRLAGAKQGIRESHSLDRQILVEPLSERELELLRLIEAGLSNRAIAEKLVISIGTVKAHTSNIYRKLEVSSRTQAVARARALGLL
jgi:LuxR family maltose regulon positive regulatory protein